MRYRQFLASLITAFCILLPLKALAGQVEISGAFNFTKNTYPQNSFSWTRRWGLGVGYYFTQLSEIELSFQDVVERNMITGYEDTTFHDKVYSVSWVQSLTGRNFPIQPYVKVGVGQLNRDATGTYLGGSHPASRIDSLTGLLGGGLRLYLTRFFAIRAEGTTYLTGARPFEHWKDNVAVTFGFSVMF